MAFTSNRNFKMKADKKHCLFTGAVSMEIAACKLLLLCLSYLRYMMAHNLMLFVVDIVATKVVPFKMLLLCHIFNASWKLMTNNFKLNYQV